ncbi:hypothetical protein [Roseobacter weihaiensis]|uniref:hypothetical protein n=1 Tax=Roseobacter weihaiensis TaxID=2763262 RepID=UPI001D0AFD85|nr:hypothetical protein [Roseobacter sp. H9]
MSITNSKNAKIGDKSLYYCFNIGQLLPVPVSGFAFQPSDRSTRWNSVMGEQAPDVEEVYDFSGSFDVTSDMRQSGVYRTGPRRRANPVRGHDVRIAHGFGGALG